ncbi:DUF5801 repeats-in-toxin domain-containing protein [Aeromonas hydrophila]|uniref:DUF5801 repeats-in-toxin domain-containing protein n=1 Tax=Aeromonas hydrophila TaxID=644 RepID=UPI00187D1D17|nr:DUF5801 repeats-in-toxin domain-containing protein [Aeromonas hydrophila]
MRRRSCGGGTSYGADGPGTTTVSGYSLSVTDSNSGLTSNGLAITLTKVGSDIVGSTTAGRCSASAWRAMAR